MKVLNLHAGLGGNVHLIKGHEITSVEYSEKIALKNKELHPEHEIIIDDAYDYLLKNYQNYGAVWSSPPCQKHTRMIRSGRNRKPAYPDFKLYEIMMFLEYNFSGPWVVENVIPYYKPLIEPKVKIGRHLFWSNVDLKGDFHLEQPKNFINKTNVKGAEELKKWLGLNYEGNIYYENNHCPAQVLRNCVHPKLGLYIFNQLT